MLFIVNPTAARGRAVQVWEEARRELGRRGIAFAEHVTGGPGEAAGVARAAFSDGVTRVVAVGGDGTLNEVINGYFDESGRAINRLSAVGLLPSGTGSDFRRTLGLATTADALRALARGRTRSLDAARIAFAGGVGLSRHLINLASFGLGGDAVRLVSDWRGRWPRWVGGRARFVAAALCALGRYRNVGVRVSLDEGRELRVESNLIVVANGRYAGGGMMFAPGAELDDGLLDVVLTDGVSRLEIVRELSRVGRGGHLRNPKVSLVRARAVTIESDPPLAVEVDGEPAGQTPARLSVLPGAVRFIV